VVAKFSLVNVKKTKRKKEKKKAKKGILTSIRSAIDPDEGISGIARPQVKRISS
jgi:hypothetical protein